MQCAEVVRTVKKSTCTYTKKKFLNMGLSRAPKMLPQEK